MSHSVTSYKTQFLEPYKKNEKGILKPDLPHLKPSENQAGVYLIKQISTGEIVYVGFSENQLSKTIYRHFQKWIDIDKNVQTRFTYKKQGYSIRIIFTTKIRASVLEKYLIVKYNPRDNTTKYNEYLSAPQIKFAEDIFINSVFCNSKTDMPF